MTNFRITYTWTKYWPTNGFISYIYSKIYSNEKITKTQRKQMYEFFSILSYLFTFVIYHLVMALLFGDSYIGV